jgi:carbonic anhydrase
MPQLHPPVRLPLRLTRMRSKYIDALVKLIEPGLTKLPRNLNKEARISAAVEANVRWSVKQLAELPEGRGAMGKREITFAGAVYELGTGSVRFLR